MQTQAPPQIPDNATRVQIGAAWLFADAAVARAFLEEFPDHLGDEITWSTEAVLLNVDGWNRSAWSDGLLAGQVTKSSGGLSAEEHRAWGERHRAFAATETLLRDISYAENRHEVEASVWLGWREATAMDTDEVEQRTATRALGADTEAQRHLTITRYTIHTAAGATEQAWRTKVRLTYTDAPASARQPVHPWSAEHWIHHTEDAAHARFTELEDGLPPVVTVAEAAEHLSTTRDALAQAMSRARRANLAEEPETALTPPADFEGVLLPAHVVSTGRTTWYDPRPLATWWHARPGHGPGRGHRQS